MKITPARRDYHPARIVVGAVPGGGRTRTALELADVFRAAPPAELDLAALAGGRVLVIDTELAASALWADVLGWHYDVAVWRAPFDPAKLAAFIRYAGGAGPHPDDATEFIPEPYDVIVVDSVSPFWRGDGGLMDIVDAGDRRNPGRARAGWDEATPLLRDLLAAIAGSPAHMILTMRSAVDYVIDPPAADGRAPALPRMVSTRPTFSTDLLEVVDVVLELTAEHWCAVVKSRCPALDRAVAGDLAELRDLGDRYSEWLDAAVHPIDEVQAGELLARLNAIEPAELRREVKRGFLATFGEPHRLDRARLAEVADWIAAQLAADLAKMAHPAAQPELDELDEAAARMVAELGELPELAPGETMTVAYDDDGTPVGRVFRTSPADAGDDLTVEVALDVPPENDTTTEVADDDRG